MAEDKKIIIDEDWKSQVQAEKETGGSPSAGDAKSGPEQPTPGAMPPATLEILVSSLVTEALIALGQIPHPTTGKVEVQKEQAKYFIDMVDMLQQKTAGNVTPEEEKFFEQLIHQLRMAFVALTAAAPTTGEGA